MHLFGKLTLVSLLTALVLSAPAPVVDAATPQSGDAAVLGSGGGTLLLQNGSPLHVALTCIELPDGTIHGYMVQTNQESQARVRVDFSSAMYVGDMLGVAGEIVVAENTPPNIVVGATMFFVLDDNGNGAPEPDLLASGVVPLAFGNPTIQQIIALIGPPPPEALSPFLNGNIVVH